MKRYVPHETLRLAVCLAIPLLAGFIGSLFTREAVTTWYVTLRKPVFTPPSWLFGPVWTALYVMMGIALFAIWRKGAGIPGVRSAIVLFVVQLILNTFWSIAFFGLRSPLLGVVVIAALWVALLLTVASFFRISSLAGWLLVPYMLWVSFASVLTFSIYFLNR